MPFNIGPGELILILVIALVVLGPGKLPDVAQSLGKSIREFRKAATDVSDAGRLDAPAATTTAPSPAAGQAAATAAPAPPPPPIAAGPAAADAPAPTAPEAPTAPAFDSMPAPAADPAPTGTEPANDPSRS
jgi:TatA/E family protein of Tat protein translocase